MGDLDESLNNRSKKPPQELRLLLIEDSPLLQSRLKTRLDVPGAMRVQAIVDSATAAKAEIDHSAYDVLIVDVELKEGSGIEVIRHARRRFGPAAPPLIIVLTNYALPVVEARCREAGADFFLDKMRQFSEVKSTIDRWHRS